MEHTKKVIAIVLSLIMGTVMISAVALPVSATDLTIKAAIGGFTQGDMNSWIEVTNTARYSVEIDSVKMVVSLTNGDITYTYYSGMCFLEPGEVKSFNYLIDYDFPKNEVGDHPCSIVIEGYGSSDLFGSTCIYNTTFLIQDDSQTSSTDQIVVNSIFSSPLTMPLIFLVIAIVTVIVLYVVIKKKKKGNPTTLQPILAPPQQIANPNGMNFCPKCGKPFSAEHQFCPHCGYKKT